MSRLRFLAACLAVSAACGGGNSTPAPPNQPTPPTPPVTAAAPTLDAPGADEQLATLRPILRVRNGVSATAGAKTYEFQISDQSDFGAGTGGRSDYYAVTFTRASVTEGSSTTSIEVDQDLQPATRFYWRARWVQGSTNGDWSSTFTLRTQIVGYNRAGELYDPLVNGQTIAEARVNGSTFVDGRGLRLHDTNAYLRYRLAQPIWNGEFSLDVEGLSDNPVSASGNTGKLKIMSMDDNPGNHYTSDYLMNVQYRGFDGNPDHAISFKVLMGEDAADRKLEPDIGRRQASVRHLNPANTYYWKATWGNFIQVLVQDGGAGGVNGSGSGQGGNTIYDYGQTSSFGYTPSSHYAYVGVNNSTDDTGSWPATYRNVWIGNKPRPATLGSALRPR
ncbi:MAG TPA: hypothetical protein VES67_09260 [Vicinamibacterales bacterium]|nr:hypothetical protein [Vicinamibacterales bacterium]